MRAFTLIQTIIYNICIYKSTPFPSWFHCCFLHFLLGKNTPPLNLPTPLHSIAHPSAGSCRTSSSSISYKTMRANLRAEAVQQEIDIDKPPEPSRDLVGAPRASQKTLGVFFDTVIQWYWLMATRNPGSTHSVEVGSWSHYFFQGLNIYIIIYIYIHPRWLALGFLKHPQ